MRCDAMRLYSQVANNSRQNSDADYNCVQCTHCVNVPVARCSLFILFVSSMSINASRINSCACCANIMRLLCTTVVRLANAVETKSDNKILTRRNFSPSMPCTLRHFHSHISDAVKLFNSICIDMHFAITCT